MKTPRFRATRLATVALMVILASMALAQDQGGPPPGGGMGGRQGGPGGGRMGGPQALDRLPSLAQLALRPEVAAEVVITDDQRQTIEEAVQAMRESMRLPQPDGEDEGTRPDPRAMMAARDKAEADADAKVRATLSVDQVKRLGEIQIQSMGLAAALVPSVQDKLGLSDVQKTKLKALVPARPQGGPGGMGGLGGGQGGPPDMQGGSQGGPPPGMQGGPGGPGGMGGPGGGGAARRKAIEAKIAAILTTDQKTTLKTLGGKAITLSQGRIGGPGGMGGPGGGGQGGPPPSGPS